MRNLVQPIMWYYDMTGLGYWAKPDCTVLYHVVCHRNVEVIASVWDSFHANPRWNSGMAEASMGLSSAQERRIFGQRQ